MKIVLDIIGGWDFFMLDPIGKELVSKGVEVVYCVPIKKELGQYYNSFFHENRYKYGLINCTEEKHYDADARITLQGANPLYKKNIKMQYAIGWFYQTSFVMCEENLKGFDHVLVYGESSKKSAQEYISSDDISIVGVPIYDKIFSNHDHDTNTVKSLYKLDDNKPIITYITTWDEHCGIDLFYKPLLRLSEIYNIIIRPHRSLYTTGKNSSSGYFTRYCPETEKSYRFNQRKRIRKINDIVKNQQSNLDSLYSYETLYNVANISDLIIVDAKSGSLAEILLCNENIPIIGLTTMSEQEKNSRFYKEIYDICPIINDSKELIATVDCLLDNDKYLKRRKKIKPYLFRNNEGNAGKDAADCIYTLLRNFRGPRHCIYTLLRNFRGFCQVNGKRL
jgi:hypothetical protein